MPTESLLKSFFDLHQIEQEKTLHGLEIILENSYIVTLFAENSRYYMTLIKILDTAKTLEISSIVLHWFTFLFASKLLKHSAKVFKAIHDNLIVIYGSLEDV